MPQDRPATSSFPRLWFVLQAEGWARSNGRRRVQVTSAYDADVKVIGHSAEPAAKAVLQNRPRRPSSRTDDRAGTSHWTGHISRLSRNCPSPHTHTPGPAHMFALGSGPVSEGHKSKAGSRHAPRNIINFTGGAKTTKKKLLKHFAGPYSGIQDLPVVLHPVPARSTSRNVS